MNARRRRGSGGRGSVRRRLGRAMEVGEKGRFRSAISRLSAPDNIRYTTYLLRCDAHHLCLPYNVLRI